MIKDFNDDLNLGLNIKIPQEQEQKLLMWDQIYECSECSIKALTNAPIYHIKDEISDAFTDWKQLSKSVHKFLEKEKKKTDIFGTTSTANYLNVMNGPPNNVESKIKFAVWGKKKNYTDDELIIKLVNVNGGVRVRVVDKNGKNLPSGALFFVRNKVILYENINPELGLTLVQNNRLYA